MPREKNRAGWDFEPGAEIGSGRTAVRLLGGGERYEAWLGWDDGLCAPVVLKLLRRDQVDEQRGRDSISREAANLRSLVHPGIVRCFGADLDGPIPYLVLEFLDGPRLSTLLRKFGPLSAEQLSPLAGEISSALCYMHNKRVVHLDVKPQNLIMGAPPRLIDLSIARTFDQAAAVTRRLGTDAYMAPEQADPQRWGAMGPWSDAWGLGATLYEAANGFRPFRRPVDDAPPTQLHEDPLPFHKRVPRAVVDAISSALVRDPAARASLEDLREAFDAMSSDARDVALRRIRRRVR